MNGEICFFEKHFDLIVHNASILQFQLPETFSKKKIYRAIHRLIQQHKAFKGANCTIHFFRKYGEITCNFLITMCVEDYQFYSFNEKGKSITVLENMHNMLNYSRTIQKPEHINSTAKILANQQACNDCIILNMHGNISRCSDSNIFLLREETIITPSLDEGALDDIMRESILELCCGLKMNILDDGILQVEDLFRADEVFMANSKEGIQWVGAFRQKRYFRKKVYALYEKLSHYYITYVENKRKPNEETNSIFDFD